MKDKNFKFLPHTADIKFQAFGKTPGKAFESSARAMFKAMCKSDLKGKVIERGVNVSAKDYAGLLYRFLEELIFLMDTEDFFLKDARVEINESKGYHLDAFISGVKASEQEVLIIVKAVTYNDMFVRKEGRKWVCQVVVDV